jgi:hypothetical protein
MLKGGHPFQYAVFCFSVVHPKKSMLSGDRLLFRALDDPPNPLNPPNPVEPSVIDASRRFVLLASVLGFHLAAGGWWAGRKDSPHSVRIG